MSESAEESQRSGAQSGGLEELDRLEQVDRRVASTVKKMVRDLQDLAAAAEDEAVSNLLAATARVDGETTQSGILTSLLEEGQRFATRTAFFLTRPGEVHGWAGRGFSDVERTQLDYEEGGVWARIAAQSGALRLDVGESAEVCRHLGAPAGASGVLIPFILRGQLGGVLYADRLEGEGALGVASLQLLTHSAAQAVETSALRGEGGSPALRSASETSERTGPMPVWQPPETQAPAAEAAAAESAVEDRPAAEDAAPAVEAVTIETSEESAPAGDDAAAAAEPAPGAQPDDEVIDAEAVDFQMVTSDAEDDRAAEEIEPELESEPELEDTGSLWEVEEDIEQEEEATAATTTPADQPPAVVPPGVGQETVRLDIAALQGQMPEVAAEPDTSEEATAKLPQWEAEPEPEPLEPEEFELEPEDETEDLEPEVSEPATAPMAAPDSSEDATLIKPASEVAPAEDATLVNPPPDVAPMEDATIVNPLPAAAPPEPSPMGDGYVPPAPDPSEEVTPPPSSGFAAPPEPSPKPDATGSSQVVPPTDVQGPGSAFEASQEAIAEGEEALHEEARRLARLLVSEIKLYNEEIIEEGRRSGNIYERLKEDIDRSRQMYQERIDPRLLEGGQDYFRQELVQRLAGGDERLLGY